MKTKKRSCRTVSPARLLWWKWDDVNYYHAWIHRGTGIGRERVCANCGQHEVLVNEAWFTNEADEPELHEEWRATKLVK